MGSAMNRRSEERVRRRIGCDLYIGDRRYSGLLLDLSPHGMFVQTAAKPAPGTPVSVHLSAPHLSEPLELWAQVARARLVPPQLRNLAKGGLGLQLEEPPEAYLRFVEEVQLPRRAEPAPLLDPLVQPEPEKKPKKKISRDRLDQFFAKRLRGVASRGGPPQQSAEEPAGRYRIQLIATAGDTTRSFVVKAASEAAARKQAAKEIGDDWEIAGVTRIS